MGKKAAKGSVEALDLTLQNAIKQYEKGNTVKGNQKLKKALNKVLGIGGKVLSGASKVAKPLSAVVGPYAVMSAAAKADDMGIK